MKNRAAFVPKTVVLRTKSKVMNNVEAWMNTIVHNDDANKIDVIGMVQK